MRSIEKRLEYSGGTPPIAIEGFGDWHIGNICCSVRALKKVVDEIASYPNSFWIGMGDYFDAVTTNDPRYKAGIIAEDIAAREDFMDAQYEQGLSLVRPIADKCIGILTGNHEETITKRANMNLSKRLARDLGVPYLGYEAYITIRCEHEAGGRTRSVRVFASHGHGGGRKPGSKINRLKDTFGNYPADFLFMAHSHDMLSYATPIIQPDRSGNIRHSHCVGQISGSYLLKHAENGATTYVERAGFPPVAIGRTWATYNPNTGRKGWHGWVDDD